jgi:CHASE2 domain-containing sensor protein
MSVLSPEKKQTLPRLLRINRIATPLLAAAAILIPTTPAIATNLPKQKENLTPFGNIKSGTLSAESVRQKDGSLEAVVALKAVFKKQKKGKPPFKPVNIELLASTGNAFPATPPANQPVFSFFDTQTVLKEFSVSQKHPNVSWTVSPENPVNQNSDGFPDVLVVAGTTAGGTKDIFPILFLTNTLSQPDGSHTPFAG